MSVNNSVCWVDIPVLDLDRAIRFYSAVLAAAVHKESAPGMEFGLLPHTQTSMIAGHDVAGEHNQPSMLGPLVYLSVDGRMDAALAAVEAGGGTVMTGRHSIGPHGFRAIVKDTEGNRIALHSTK